MSINVNSITDSYNAWYDYRYGKNTRGLTADDIAQIETRWKDNIASWKTQAAKDENKYEITDDDFGNAKNNGKNEAKASTGHDGKADTWGTVKGAVGGGAAAIVGVGGAAVGGLKMAGAFSKTTTGAVSELNNATKALNAGTKTTAEIGDMTENVNKVKNAKGNSLIGASILAGTGTLLYAASRIIRSSDPNGDDARALQELAGSTLPEAQGELMEAQSNMEEASEATIELTEEANANNDDTNDEIADSKAEFDMYRKAAEILQDKQRNGVALSGFEQDFLKEVTPILEELGGHINGVAEENTETTQGIYDEIGGYQETFDESAETVAEVQGVTEFAAGFDETTASNTEVMATVAEFGGQGGQAVSAGGIMAGVVGAAKMGSIFTFGEGVAMVALGGVATAAGAGASQQFGKLKEEQTQYNQIAQAEIQTRGFTESLNAGTQEAYDEQIEVYDDNISIVEDLEMYIPDDLEVPDTTTQTSVTAGGESDGNKNAGANAGGNVSGTSSSDTGTNDPKKDKKDVK